MITIKSNSQSIAVKSRHEIKLIQEAGRIVAGVHNLMIKTVEPGMSTLDLDQLAEQFIRKAGALPTFKGYYGFPATLCTSINEEVVHGIPKADRILKDGDVISLDCGATYKGFIADSAITLPIGNVPEDIIQLLKATDEGLHAGIQAMRPGNRIIDVAAAVEDIGIHYGYGIVKNYGGHGVGKNLHEEPFIPNYRTENTGPEIRPGNVMAIEPMFNLGTADVETLEDQWTVVTKDRKPSAHFEHTIIVTEDGPLIATLRDNL